MLLDRSKIPATITTHEQLISWAGLCLRFNLTGVGVTQTFVRSSQDPEPTRLIDAGIFRDAAGTDRIAVLVYPEISPLWQGTAQKPWEYALPLSLSAQAAMFNV
jgi:hypothetical protein